MRKMNRIKTIAFLLLLPLAFSIQLARAQYGNTPPLHREGNQLKDPHGNTVVLHGVMDTPSPYFNSYRWGNSCNSSTVTPCINYFNKLFTAITDTTHKCCKGEGKECDHQCDTTQCKHQCKEGQEGCKHQCKEGEKKECCKK